MTRILYFVLAVACFGHAAMTSYYTRYVWDGHSNQIPALSAFLWLGWPPVLWRAGARKWWMGLLLPGFIALVPTLQALFWGYVFSGMH
jgi:hypothetical protein